MASHRTKLKVPSAKSDPDSRRLVYENHQKT